MPPLLTPLVEAGMPQLIAEINRAAAVRSIRGKVDIQFLDTSFAECGVAEKYRTADGEVTIQRPGQVYLLIQAPFGVVKIAEMTSDGERFRVAVFQGEEKYRRFVRGTNNAVYPKLENNGAAGGGGAQGDCGNNDGKQQAANMRRAVSSLSGLRPQHFTDALLIRPVAAESANSLYAQIEAFEEEPDARPGAKRNARVVRPYYVLTELVREGEGSVRVSRRFWFNRVGELSLARVQTYEERGQLTTDVVYKEPKNFGADGRYKLSSQIELTRPQDRYSIRINYQTPEAVTLDRVYAGDVFILVNKSQLPEVDLDAKKQ
ncbi:MAG TPA: hypothetical protein VM866_03295 [Pyrinomonadaceae bacterium]|nr:hypothetical protein [Pyrinomonadaceae bacterium]